MSSFRNFLNQECSKRADLICGCIEMFVMGLCGVLFVFLFFAAIVLMDF